MRTITLGLVTVLLAGSAAPLVGAAGNAADADGDLFPDAVERVLGASPYNAADTPAGIGVNAIVNPGFEIQAQPVANHVTCPVFGDFQMLVLGLVYVTPCRQSVLNQAQWSTDTPGSRAGDRDMDGDMEMVVPANAGAHNFWHSFANVQQAFSPNFERLSFDLEIDSPTKPSLAALAPYGRVQISTSLTPFDDPNMWLAVFVECHLTFPSALLDSRANWTAFPGPNNATYWHVEIAPTAAPLGAYWEGCADEANAYNGAATEEAKRGILAGQRITQTSFWAFNGLVFDNVDLRGSKPPLGDPNWI